jgi:hypothetical protein
MLTKIYLQLTQTRLVFITLFLLLLIAAPLSDTDYFWHLKTGEYIVAHRALPAGDIFSFTRFGQTWVMHEWLFEVLLYEMYAAAGPFGVKLLSASFAVFSLGMTFLLMRRIGASPTWCRILSLAAVVPFFGGLSPRPHLVTYAALAIFMFVLLNCKYRRARHSLLVLPIVMVVWVNAHGGYVIGIALACLFAACEWSVYLTSQRRTSMRKRRLIRLSQVVILIVLASLANPGFVRHWLYPFQVLGMAAAERIQEWQSPNFHELGAKAYLLLVVLFLLSYTYSKRKPDLTELMVPGFFLINGFLAIRHIPLAALAITPFIGLAISSGTCFAWPRRWKTSALGRFSSDWGARELGQSEFVLNWIVLALLAAGLTLFAPILRANEETRINRTLPVGAANYVISHNLTGNMFNSYDYGGYLIYRLAPHWKVCVDGRADVYGDKFLLDFLEIYEGKPSWREKFRKLSIDFAIVSKDAPIRQLLLADGSFQEVFVDEQHSVLQRSTPKFALLQTTNAK